MEKTEGFARGFGSPTKYVQGPGEIRHLKEYAHTYGKNIFILIDGFLYDSMHVGLETICKDENGTVESRKFGTEICTEEIESILESLKNKKIDVVIGVGGGKTLDTSKVVAEEIHAASIIVPTAASTDAPTSALSVIYKKTGEHSHEAFLKNNPEVVLVDTDIVLKAPVRLLVSGMGDALATFFEARACRESRTNNFVGRGFRPTLAGEAIAKTCYETLLREGVKAKESAKALVNSEAFENVVEANTLLSGLGFESTGCAAAHGIHDALTALPETSRYYHGEKVAFGTLCLLCLENRPMKEIEEVARFSVSVGLPVTFREIGITNVSKEHLMPVAIKASQSMLLAAEPVTISPERIYGAMVLANQFGRNIKGGI